MQISLSPEVEEKARQIPGLPERVEQFITGEIVREQMRARRYSPEVEEIVREAMIEAEKRRKNGASHEEAVDRIIALYERMSGASKDA